MESEKIFKKVLDCSFQVHTALGPGLLESAYVECLYYDLIHSELDVEKQKALPLIYMEVNLEAGYSIDLLSKCRLGLLVNFNVLHLKDGIKRVIL